MASSPKQSPARILLNHLLLCLLLSIGLGAMFIRCIPAYNRASELERTSPIATAQITNVYYLNKVQTAVYTFQANNRAYTGESAYMGKSDDRGAIDVYYVAGNPSISAIDPTQNLASARHALGFIAIWNIFISVVLVYRVVKAKCGWTTP